MLILFSSLLLSIKCSNNEDYQKNGVVAVDTTKTTTKNTNITLKYIHATALGEEGKADYTHYLLLLGYKDEYFQDINYVNIAETYLDTCNLNKGFIGNVYFLKSIEDCGFPQNELKMYEIRKNSLLGFGISKSKIDKVWIFNEGYENSIECLISPK